MGNWNIKLITKLTALLVVGLAIIYSITWLATHGTLEITFEEAGQKEIIIKNSDKNISIITDEALFSVRLPSGNYSVLVKSESKSSLDSISVGRFLTSTKVNSNEVYQASREFYGDNPSSCAEFVNDQFVSFPCNGSFYSMAVHIPATKTLPTYKKSIGELTNSDEESLDTPGLGVIEGVQNEGDFLLVLVNENEGEYNLHNLYAVEVNSNTIKSRFIRSINTLQDDKIYTYKKSDSGIMLYSPDLSSVAVGSGLLDLKRITIPDSIKIEGVSPIISELNNGTYLISTEMADQSFDKNSQGTSPAKVYIFKEQEVLLEKSFPNGISKIDYCLEYICMLDKTGNLKVLDYNLNLVNEFYDINEFSSSIDNFYFADDNNIYSIDKGLKNGGVVISLGEYKFGGIISTSSKIIVSMLSANKSHALLLGDRSEGPYIDDDLVPVFNNPFVNTISIYKSNIFISPELGERVIDPNSNTLVYDEKIKKAAKESIEASIEETGLLDRSYTIKVNLL